MSRLIFALDTVLRLALLVLAVSMLITVVWQVISRYALSSPSSVTEEIARFQLIWLGLLGAAYTFRQRMHVGIDIFTSTLQGKSRVVAEISALIASLIFSIVILIFGGLKLVVLTHELQQTSAALEIRLSFVYLALPISGVLIAIYALHFIASAYRLWREQVFRPAMQSDVRRER